MEFPMRTRSLTFTGLVTTAALTGSVFVAGGHATARGERNVRFYAEYAKVESLDLGAPGIGIGDRLVYNDMAFDSAKKQRKLGVGFGDCVRVTGNTETTGIYQCTETVRLEGGDVFIGGLYDLAAKSDLWAITGGTGRHRSAGGVVVFRPLTATTLDGVFHFDR
jgi:hypothetical protein